MVQKGEVVEGEPLQEQEVEGAYEKSVLDMAVKEGELLQEQEVVEEGEPLQ